MWSFEVVIIQTDLDIINEEIVWTQFSSWIFLCFPYYGRFFIILYKQLRLPFFLFVSQI